MPRRGPDPFERVRKFSHKTFKEGAAKYLAEFDGKDKDRPMYALQSVVPYIGDTRMWEVDSDSLIQYKDDRARGQGFFIGRDPAMAGTINKEIAVTATVLRAAWQEWGWILEPRKLKRVKVKKGGTREPYQLSWEEQDALFKLLPWGDSACLFCVNTGVRKSELFGLRWSDKVEIPELDIFAFILDGDDTKNGEDRPVICNSIARSVVEGQESKRKDIAKKIREIEVMLAQKLDNKTKRRLNRKKRRLEAVRRSPYVFPSYMGKRITSTSNVFNPAWIEAGLPDTRLVKKGVHNLRHTYGCRLRACGVSDEDRDYLMGHNGVSLTQHYAMPTVERLSERAERIVERREMTILRVVRSVA